MKRILALCVLISLQSFAADIPSVIQQNDNNGFFDTSELTAEIPPNRSINLRVNPLMIGVGAWNADLDIAVNDWLTLGPTFTYYLGNRNATVSSNGVAIAESREKFGAYNFGVRANFYIESHRLSDGWILAPYAGIAPGSASVNFNGKEYEGKFTGFIAGLVFSRQWVWNSGVNFTIGAGFAYVGLPENTPVTSKTGDGETLTAGVLDNMPFRRGKLLPSFDLSLGFAL